MAKVEKEDLVEVEELVWEMSQQLDSPEERVRVVGIGNGLMVSKAAAVEGIKSGIYRAAGRHVGKVPEEWEAHQAADEPAGQEEA